MGDGCIDFVNADCACVRRIAVFDLDGTVYDGPTFRRYLFSGAQTLLRRGSLMKSFLVMWRFVLSKAGVISHKNMKYKNCRLLERMLKDDDIRKLVDALIPDVNTRVLDLMRRLKGEGYITVLSTASPESYCRLLADRLDFDVCHATLEAPQCKNEYVENRGERKLHNLRKLESELTACLSVVVTDHHDDLPLLKANSQGENYLVNPSETTVAIIESSGIKWVLI